MFYSLENATLVYKDKAKDRIRDIKVFSEKLKHQNKKKTQWVFVFSTPFDLQKLAKLIENSTKPRELLDLERIPQPDFETAQESERKQLYLNRMGLNIDQNNEEGEFVKTPEKIYEVNEYEGDEEKARKARLKRDMEIIRNKALQEEKRKEEALLLEMKKKNERIELQKEIQNNLEERNMVELTWKINFQNFILENLKDNSLNNSIPLGIKLFNLVSDFKVFFLYQINFLEK